MRHGNRNLWILVAAVCGLGLACGDDEHGHEGHHHAGAGGAGQGGAGQGGAGQGGAGQGGAGQGGAGQGGAGQGGAGQGGAGQGGAGQGGAGQGAADVPHTMFLTEGTTLVAYDIATGKKLEGTVANANRATDMQVLADGTLIMNLTDRNEVLVVDGPEMLELARIPSSAGTGTRPVHGYLTPKMDGKQYWMALNDGDGMDVATNSVRFIDLSTWKPVGEVALGMGHHKASFGVSTQRVVISNISDCEKVLGVYDFTDPANIAEVVVWSAEDFGYDGSETSKTCDNTRQNGVALAPHGCATAFATGKAYCNLTGVGKIVEVDIDAQAPTAKVLDTTGSGAGYTAAHTDGRHVFSVQSRPREGAGADACFIGQLLTIDSQTGDIAATPLRYKGPDCTDSLVGSDEESARPGHLVVAGDKLFITPAGGHGNADARVRYELVLDIADPMAPEQLASLPIAAGTGHVNDALSGDGKYLFVAGQIDGKVTQIDVEKLEVVRNFEVGENPSQVETYGSKEGPSHQTGPHHHAH